MNETGEGSDKRPVDEQTFPTLSHGPGMAGMGEQIGGYKLLKILGEGGFGTVYLAEQQRPMKRQVALKMIKPGMDTKQVIARFEAERQALAMLDHPHIARVFDAGATESGRPYFAMEYVKGVPITEYCDRHNLGTQERLRLFIPLCQAIQHAHQKGIVHRDVKPSNAMVTLHDQKPIPKIIDFGVAKALHQRLTEKTLVTEEGQFLGTPTYMSPEQAELTGLDVDTRTDIYSLGVLLYELLTGCTPFDPEELRSKGYAQMQRIICEQDPLKPSTKLTTLGNKLEEIAKHRSATAEQLRKSVRGDLDWIVMKALEKDPARRYGTAEALADDIERHLNHLPVSAGSPGILYHSRKFVRRHRSQVLVGGFLLALVILSAAILGQHLRIRRRLHTVQKEFEAKQEMLAIQSARSSLSAAQADYASGQYADASKALDALVDDKYVGPKARLLRARMALDQPDANVPMDELRALLDEPNNVASQAHLLLAKIYLESQADDDETARELERKATEHQQKAESLASSSAEAAFNRALLADTPAERMGLLEEALALNPGHVDSRRIRALTHYASRNYEQMEIDASVITAVARDNPEGYALRALALRERAQLRGQTELLNRAISEHSQAIELAPTQARFYDERRETFMRMGEYEKALADAQECIRLSPKEGIYHFHAFCALTALGRYGEAQREYQAILTLGGSSRGEYQFRKWAAVYAIDIVDRHASWHPAGQEPDGPAFTILRQAIEAHQTLAKKARCVAREGAVASWSPNGEELAYGRGPLGHMAIEVLNLKTWTTRLLCYSGFDPAWSPDGQYIAFVRHRKITRLQDLVEVGEPYLPGEEDRSVWIANADGTGKPRVLARGDFPSWSQNPKRLYYHSPEEGGYLCSISVEGDNPSPTRVIRVLGRYPVVSPDEKYVVWHARGWNILELVKLSSGKVVAGVLGYFPNWSTDGKALVFTRIGGRGRDDGVWICDLEQGKAALAIEDWVCYRCSWSSNTGQIALSPLAHLLRAAGTEEYSYSGTSASIWVCSLDKSIFEAGSSALVRDWPWEESDTSSLMQMLMWCQTVPERAAEANPLRHRLMDVLQQAVASSDMSSIQPVQQLADLYLWFGRYDDAEQLYLETRDHQLAKSGATSQGFLDLTEELVRLYLDVLDRCDKAEPLCLELLKARSEVLGTDSPRALRTLILLARIAERQRRYKEAERLCLDLLKVKPRQIPKESTPESYESPILPGFFAPLSYFLDETAFTLRVLDDPTEKIANDKRWVICAHHLLARLYATCPTVELHNLSKALEHATSACELSGWTEPICLATLGAVHAEAGRFDEAVRRQKEAIAHLPGMKSQMIRMGFEERLKRYEHGMTRLPKGMMARWEFEHSKDGIVPDSSGNNLHGCLVGDARIYVDPERGHVLRLDGDGDWVDCGADQRFDLTDEITVSVWIKVGRFDKDWQAIVAKGDGTWRLQRDRTTDTLQFACSGVDGLAVGEGPSSGVFRGHTNVNDGKWHHVVGTYDGRQLSLYIDGELDALMSVFAFTCIDTSEDRALIGMNGTAKSPREWNGLIDDVRIYNYALSEVEVKALYDGKESGAAEK